MAERESKIQERSMKIIRRYGGYVYKNAQNMYTEKGRPDLTACIPVKIETLVELFGKDTEIGVFVGIEMKREGYLDNLSDAQKVVLRQIKNAKGLAVAVDDSNVVEGLVLKLIGGSI